MSGIGVSMAAGGMITPPLINLFGERKFTSLAHALGIMGFLCWSRATRKKPWLMLGAFAAKDKTGQAELTLPATLDGHIFSVFGCAYQRSTDLLDLWRPGGRHRLTPYMGRGER